MYEFVPTHKRSVVVSDCDPSPKMPFTPYKLRREHPELLPKVNKGIVKKTMLFLT